MYRPLSARALAAVLLALVTLATACGDSSTAKRGTTDSTATGAAGTTGFCAAAGRLVTALGSGGDPSKALKTAIDRAPGPLAKDLSTLGEKFGTAASSGDDSAFLADDLRETASTTFAGIASNCDYQTANISATEYKFGGLPATLAAGPTAFHMTNRGSEVHEMLFYRRAKGTEGDIVSIVNDEPTVSDGRLEEIGVMLPAAPGEDSVLLVDLTPGDYVAVCFVAEGTTSMAQVAAHAGGDASGDHRSLGMIKAFTVG